MLFLRNEDIDGLFTVDECVAAMREVYRQLEAGEAAELPRQDVIGASPASDSAIFSLKAMGATTASDGIGVIRINSDAIDFPVVHGVQRRHRIADAQHGKYNGSILLFGARNGQLLAVMNDGIISATRVGATSAVAADLMARPDASRIGLLGTGRQAGSHLEAMCVVRDISRAVVYGPTTERLDAFCARYSSLLGIDVVAATSPEEVARDADILVTATNSLTPTVDRSWLRPGMHVACVRRTELEPALLDDLDRVVVNANDPVAQFFTREGRARSPERRSTEASLSTATEPVDLAAFPTLGRVLVDGSSLRSDPADVTCFYNIQGLGVQFAPIARLAYDRAQAAGDVGLHVDDAWVLQSIHS